MTKVKILLAATIVSGLFIIGCATTSPDSAARAARVTQAVAYDAGLLSLRGKNNTGENRMVLINITNQLASYLEATNISPETVRAYIAQLPIPQLRSTEGQVITSGAFLVIDELGGGKLEIPIDNAKLKPVIAAAMAGLGNAVRFAELNPNFQ